MKERSPVIKLILDAVKRDMEDSAPIFYSADVTAGDMEFLYEECSKQSEFDPYNRRNLMYNALKDGDARLIVKKCEYGKILAVLLREDQEKDIPWELWGRILRMYAGKSSRKFRIFFLADDRIRTFPEKGHKITPPNINGGYTYSCNTKSIIIYKAEDATRVLIHELMHSSCADNHENGIDIVEAETEAWAELIYIALLSQGKPYIFNALLERQSEWIRKQNNMIRKHYIGDEENREFPWRYTIGKEEVWRRWGILDDTDSKPDIKIGISLRLTYPPSDILKSRFKVSNNSTIL